MKSTLITRATCLAPLAFAISPLIATAGTDAKEVIPEVTPASISPWEFTLTPYGWLTGLDGTVGAKGITADVDAPFFNDILDNIKMAAALNFEARNGKWGIIVDGFYADLGADGAPPGPAYKSASVDLKQFIGQAEIAYRIYDSPKGFVDVFAGARYTAMWETSARSSIRTASPPSAPMPAARSPVPWKTRQTQLSSHASRNTEKPSPSIER